METEQNLVTLYLSCEVEQQTVNYHISCRVVALYSA